MRLRIKFAKTESMRYTSHLDLHRTWERTIRRAGLPLSYSQGFNPRPKLNLAAALPLGFTSNCELIEIWLDEELPETFIYDHLKTAVPPGIEIIQVRSVDSKTKKIPNLVNQADYQITFRNPIPNLPDRIEKIIKLKTIIRERRGKTYDLRPLIDFIEVQKSESDHKQLISLRLASRTGATGRPDEVLAEMGIPLTDAIVHRTKLHLKES